MLESLEDRTLLASSTLSILPSGLLTYAASLGAPNNLTVSYTSPNYTFTDTGETIALGGGTSGWTLSNGNHTAVGPGATVTSIAINTPNGNDTVAITSLATSTPTSIAFNDLAGNADTVVLGGGIGGVQNILGSVTITNLGGTTALTVNDSGDTAGGKPQSVFLSGGEITNLELYPIVFGGANLSSLTILGASTLGTLNVNANDQGPVAVTPGLTTGSGTIVIGTNAPINYSSFQAVNISNAADQPLTQVSQTITTSTGDAPTEGKAFTYLAATFADADLQGNAKNFVATIDWGDGTAPVVGSVAADGAGEFQASGSHTYEQSGQYPVVTTITDLSGSDALSIGGIAVTISDLGGGGLTTGSVAQVNLVSNTSSIPAPITDPNLVNSWGIAGDANGNAWVADEGSGVATYEGPGGSTPEGTTVIIPPASGHGKGSPTGIVFNSTPGFAINGRPSAFLYATLDGTISGWNGKLPNSGSPTAVIAVNNAASGAVYTGLTIATVGNQPLLYAANFHTGEVEVYNSQFHMISEFTDPDWPNGYAPYNVQSSGGDLYVTFAKQDQTKTKAVPGLGNGFLDEFAPSGALIQRFVTGAPLDAPWGLAMAPAGFGQYSDDLLVANQGNGEVDAFNPATGQFLGAFADAAGAPITNGGLHGLFFGAGGSLYFTAGPGGGADGVFGSLSPTPDTVTIATTTLAAAISNITAFVNQPYNGVVATFTDANIYALASDFTATINWGDGSADTSGDGNLTIIHTDGIGSSFLVQGIHTYTTSTTGYPLDIVTITIAENGTPNTVFAQGTASVSEPTLHVALSAITAIVNEPYTGPVATFTDDAPDPNPGDYTANIDWGDGSSSTGKITLANQAGQSYIVSDGGLPLHAYAATTTGQTSYVVTVTVTKTGENSAGKPVDESGVAAGNVSVSDPTIHAVLSGFAGFVGQVYTGPVATFTDDAPDTDAGDYSATIDWGDGATTTGLIRATNQAGQSFVVYDGGTGGVLHSYALATTGTEPYVVKVTIDKTTTDTQGFQLFESAQAVGTVAVSLPTLHATFTPYAAVAGASYSGPVATFTDDDPVLKLENNPLPNPNNFYTATITWGDGTRSFGQVVQSNSAAGAFIVTGTHTYMFPTTGLSPDVASVTITKNATAETSVASGNETVADSLLFPYSNQFLTVTEGSNQQIVAGLFTDADPFVTAANFNGPFVSQTIISWGDNKSTVGTIQADPNLANVFDVVGLHIYGTPTPIGQYDTISVSVTDQWGGKTTITSNMTVTPAALNFKAPFAISTDDAAPITEGKSFTSDVAIFNSNNPDSTAGEYTASIDWGDGSTPLDAGTIKEDGKAGFHVSGTHTYLTTGVFNISVTILVVGSPAPVGPTLTSMATVYGAPIQYTPPSATVMTTTTGTPIPVNANFTAAVGSFTSTNPDADPNNFLANIDWGDGDSSFGDITNLNTTPGPGFTSTTSYSVTGTHKYATAGPFVVTLTIDEQVVDGGSATGSFLIAPTPPSLIANILGLVGIPKKNGDFITAAQPFTTEVATFESDDPFATASDFSASIDWGDGSSGGPDLTSATVIQGANDPSTGDPTYFLIGSHTYDTANDAANPSYMFTVFVSTPGAASVASQPTEAVAYAPTLIAQPAPIAGTQGTMLPDDTVVATFTDPEFISDPATFGSGTTANVNWGDGSSDTVNATFAGSSPAGTSFVIEDSHDYAAITDVFQAYQVSVTITTPDGSAAVVNDLAVMNVPVLTAQPLALPAVAGNAFTVPVAAIHTASAQTTAADFAATIQWGDGQSSSGMLQPQAGGTIEVLGSHSYANPGSFPVAITLTDKQGNTVTDTRTATVSNPLIVEALPVSVHLNKMFKGTVVRFTDAEPGAAAGNFTVLITWGDLTTSDGIVVADGSSSSGATFLVNGSHRYTVKGTFPIKVTVVDNSGDQGSASTSVLVGSKSEHGSRPFHRPVARASRLTPSHQPPRIHQRSGSEAIAALVHPGGPLRHFKHS